MDLTQSARSQAFETIDCPEDLTLQTAEGFREALLARLGDNPNVCVRAPSTGSLDLAGVQLLVSAKRSAEARGGAVALSPPASGAWLETLRRGGFLASPEACVFWLGAGV